MSEPPLNPLLALKTIRTFAKVALTNEEPTLDGYELILREILSACDQALPKTVESDAKGEGE